MSALSIGVRLGGRPCAVPQRPLNLQGTLTQMEDISENAERALEIPIMAVTSSSNATPAPTAGHDSQLTTVTLLLSSSSSSSDRLCRLKVGLT